MSSSAINQGVLSAKISNVQNAADSSAVYSAGAWSFKNASAVTSVQIDNSGNVGVGVTPSAWGSAFRAIQLSSTGAIYSSAGNSLLANNFYNDGTNSRYLTTATAGGYLINGATHNWYVASSGTAGNIVSFTAAMTIDVNGNISMGPAGSRKLNVTAVESTGLGVIVADNSSTSSTSVGGITTSIGSGNGLQNNTNCWHFRGVTANVGIWYLYGNGTSSFTSDQRLKKNIEPARDGYVEDLCKLRVVKYNWITNEDSEAKELGLIAQEVEQVFPNLVQEADVEFEGGLKPKVLKSSVLPFMLLKAIQELSAKVDAQAAEIAALKAK